MKKFLVPIFVLAILVLGGVVFLYAISQLPSRNISWENPTQPVAEVGDFFKNLFSSGKFSMLILGKPGKVSGQSASGEELTDTIMVAHFNPDLNKIYLISIPRDLWIADNNEQFKINEMLVKDEAGIVVNKVESITGVPLDGYVVVDLTMVKDAVDYFGGVDVVLSRSAVDWVSRYTLEAGPHRLNGDDAVWLIRNRFDREGDFFREKNQQQIIVDLFEKFKKMSLTEKMSFIDKFVLKSGLLKTSDLDVSKLTAYAINTDLSKVLFGSVVLDFSTKLFKTDMIPVRFGTSTQDVSILIPIEGFEKYGAVRKYIKAEISK